MKLFVINIIFLLSVYQIAVAQEMMLEAHDGDVFNAWQVDFQNHGQYILKFPDSFTAFSVLIPVSGHFDEISVTVSGKAVGLIPFGEDEVMFSDSLQVSDIIFTGKAINEIIVSFSQNIGRIFIHTYHAGKVYLPENHLEENFSGIDCSKPLMVDQDQWRSGLTPPTVKPTYTRTAHIVIHHSAGSNTSVNHLEDVRNIYLYHTKTLGWDDIGYNFLIARDGTIYSGRDGQGWMEDDFVKGAHFCGKNTNTMGICLLGEYSLSLPTPQALFSLKKLILWKCHKDQLNPLDSALHPPGSDTALLLPVICGHRDGCSTECPGTAAYVLLPSLRSEVDSLLSLCFPVSTNEPNQRNNVSVFPNPSDGNFEINISGRQVKKLILMSPDGKIMDEKVLPLTGSAIYVDNLPKGIWFLRIYLIDGIENHKVIIE